MLRTTVYYTKLPQPVNSPVFVVENPLALTARAKLAQAGQPAGFWLHFT